MSLLGIKGKLNWIKSFLLDRHQSVGSVIGPLLFLILIGDIDADIKSSFLSSFADDTRIGKGIRYHDVLLLQADLNSVYKWAEHNNMKFNNFKFELLRYGTISDLINTTYEGPDGKNISEKPHVQDLGVTMTNNGTFSEHINKICQSARDILRTFKSCSPDLMRTTWKTLVLPILDYCSQLWCPIKPGQIRFCLKMDNRSHIGTKEFREINWFPVRDRFEQCVNTHVFKQQNNSSPKYMNEVFTSADKSQIKTRASSYKLKQPNCKKVSGYRTISYLGPKLWNMLPNDIKSAESVNSFKHRIKKHYFSELVRKDEEIFVYY